MDLTVAQKALLRDMEDGWEVTYHSGHYRLTRNGELAKKFWPSTFYGLFDNNMVTKLENGNYGISNDGRQQG